MSELPDASLITNFIASRVIKSIKKGAPNKESLAGAIAEVELETQILGASFIKVAVIDPEWVIQTSGWLELNSEGLLQQIEVEFPEKSGWFWRLCAVEGSNEVSQPNLTLTFEDRIVAYLRDYWGPKTAPPGTTTRAQFIRDLVREVGQKGEPKIRFVCPAVNKVQPLEVSTKEKKEKLKTATAKASSEQKENKTSDTGKLTAGQYQFAGELASQTGLDSRVVAAWCLAEESGSAAAGRENEHNNNWLNIGYFDSGAGAIAFESAFKEAKTAAAQTSKFLHGEWGGASSGILAILKTAGQEASAQITAIATSGWASSGYNGGSTLRSLYGEISGTEAPPSGPSSNQETTSDVGQLQRGTSDNPDEDSWDCITRLAQQVQWRGFTDGNTLFYITDPELRGQKPALYVNVPENTITKTADNRKESGVVLQPLTYTFDNTTFEYRKTHKVKGKVQRKSKATKPSTPSEVRMNLVCGITDYRAGDVVVFQGSGIINGRWIISDSTRNCLKDTFTQFILSPPIDPSAEPLASSESDAAATGGVAEQAKKALSEKSKYKYVYGGGRQSGASLFEAPPREMDCSSFTILCYKAAGAPDPAGLNYSPIGATQSMIENMEKTSTPKPGDVCFFGTLSHTTHVTVYVGNGRAISMGKEGDPEEGPAETTGPSGFLGYWTLKGGPESEPTSEEG